MACFNRRNLFDLFLVLFVGLVILLLNIFAKPYERGFFCNDVSIRYPFKEPTISNLQLSLIALPIPVIVIFLCEGVILFESCTPRDSCRSVATKLCANTYYFGGMFIFGSGLSQLTVSIAKYSVGRLRPHFISVCTPTVDCTKLSPYHYVSPSEYSCSNYAHLSILEGRQSFPSGHSALSFYAAFYVMMYLQKRMVWSGSYIFRHMIQAIFIYAAWFTALSRVQDNMHHWDDVLAGIIIGTCWTIFMVKHIVDFNVAFKTTSDLLVRNNQKDAQIQAPV